MNKISIFLIAFGIWIVPTSWVTVNGTENPMTAAGVVPFIEKHTAPGFTLEDLNGNRVDLEDFRGKNVLIFFWATW